MSLTLNMGNGHLTLYPGSVRTKRDKRDDGQRTTGKTIIAV